MSRFTRLFNWLLGIAISTAIAHSQVLAETHALATMSRFLQAAYPDLRGKEALTELHFIQIALGQSFSPESRGISFEVWNAGKTRMLLTGSCHFEGSPSWISSYGAGDVVTDSKRDAFKGLLKRHPKWSRAQKVTALKEAGARYGPNDRAAFLKEVPIRQLQEFLGPFQVDSVDLSTDLAEWTVFVWMQRPGEGPNLFFLAYEPFGGRLVQIGRLPHTMTGQHPRPSSKPVTSVTAAPCAPGLCQSTDESGGLKSIEAFLTSVYPELMTQKVDAEVSSKEAFDKPWRQLRMAEINLWDHPELRDVPIVNPFDERNPNGYRARLLMKSSFVLDDKGRVTAFEGLESFVVNSGKNADLRGLVESHPDWTEARSLEALAAAGPRFGPSEQQAFLGTNPLSALEAFLGKLTVGSIKFESVLPAGSQRPMVAFFRWHIVVQAQRAGESTVSYVLHFEPFGGKLTDIQPSRTSDVP